MKLNPKDLVYLPRMRFKIIEAVILFGNIVHGVCYTTICESNTALGAVGTLLSCLNYFRIIRRVKEFDKNIRVLMKSSKFFLKNLIIFVTFNFGFAAVVYSMLNNQLLACQVQGTDFPPRKDVHFCYIVCRAWGNYQKP